MDQNAKTLMVLGTASGVGKSTLVVGLCRLLRRRGLRVAPFKAQNISDNAHLLPDGRRMARSQAIAAAACGLAPEPDMNPVLLIPRHGGCEAVVDGAAVPRFDRDACRAAARRAYDRLAQRFEAVVAEGAGSAIDIGKRIHAEVGIDPRVTVLGHIQRGGSPTARDRETASRMGYEAVLSLVENRGNRIIAIRDGHTLDLDMEEALAMTKTFQMDRYQVLEALTNNGGPRIL